MNDGAQQHCRDNLVERAADPSRTFNEMPGLTNITIPRLTTLPRGTMATHHNRNEAAENTGRILGYRVSYSVEAPPVATEDYPSAITVRVTLQKFGKVSKLAANLQPFLG
jgi:hypothetical protein